MDDFNLGECAGVDPAASVNLERRCAAPFCMKQWEAPEYRDLSNIWCNCDRNALLSFWHQAPQNPLRFYFRWSFGDRHGGRG